MSSACGCEPVSPVAGAEEAPEERTPWWRDRGVMVPVASGVSLVVGLLIGWLMPEASALAFSLFWVSLLLGASQFVPNALTGLFTRGRLGIGVLMTISAIGAVLLGFIEEAAALAFLYSMAEALEDRAMDKATTGLRALLTLIPSTATVVRAGVSQDVSVEELSPGDVLILVAGERLATDGVIRSGHSSLDTSAITGESLPVEVGPGDTVLAGSINTSGVLEIEVTAAGTDNSLTAVVTLVEQAQHDKGQRARIADRLARPLVPGVLILAIVVAVVGSLLGDPAVWIERALVVLVAASPCALAISVPVTVVSAIGAASKFGVIIKSGSAFERLGDIGHLAFDKTGTLTQNRPTVVEVLTAGTDTGVTEGDVLRWAATLEQHSSHPLAAAVMAATPEPAFELSTAHQVTETAGRGLAGIIDGALITVGSPRWLHPGALGDQVAALENNGVTVIIVQRNTQPVGAIGIRDKVRAETSEVINALKNDGFGITMLTGDNARTAQALGTQAGITDIRAQLHPDDKASAVSRLAEHTPVAMIGDGINDAPALAAADVGIAMGATGSDAAIESADIAIAGDDLRLVRTALLHARRGRRIINQNIILSLLIIVVLLPLAITGVLGLAAVVLVHEVAEVIVILNGMRAARTRSLP